ncbi:GntR family transcriptional regulator [Duganella radicis]|uniref:FCD domain-containing protein n=1 Tax=Duganella radicis TaxID=551988 RepID=A0A6L6PD25_9BURK|nr:FCD domain-containing protein [Duganella radicis]MTV36982.1 FCD domain-containing protein [Duganella radicis]
MAKLPITTRRSINLLLEHAANHLKVGDAMPTEMQMTQIVNSSRTAVRSALAHMVEHGLIAGMKQRHLLRRPRPDDYFDVTELHSATEQLQQVLMERIYERDLPPGAEFTEVELSRAAGVSTIAVREFLIGFSRNGLIEKTPRGSWRLCAFDSKFAQELGEAREMFELRAIERIATLAPDHPAFARLADLLARHEALGKEPAESHAEFPALDREFHSFLISLLDNRFAENLNEAVSMVYHYHYQWDKRDELPRNQYAVQEHVAILRPLVGGDLPAAMAAMRRHLHSSRSTMLNALHARESSMPQA